jgi:hypothetical protein
MTIKVGVAWATHFHRSGFDRMLYRKLRYAYRAPSLFLEGKLQAGAEVRLVTFDENLDDADLGQAGSAQQVDILYVATHGLTGRGGFELALYENDWAVLSGGFGEQGPSIVIFDCCDLTDLSPGWDKAWRTKNVGRHLRLVLGFSTPASVSLQSTLRGKVFAEKLATLPVADAWFASIQVSAYIGTDKPVAIAFGDDDADAEQVVGHAWAASMPGPRSSDVPGVAWRS